MEKSREEEKESCDLGEKTEHVMRVDMLDTFEGTAGVSSQRREEMDCDDDILNALCYGLDVHILSMNHFTCEGDEVIFNNYINNNDTSKRVIFIPDSMKNEF